MGEDKFTISLSDLDIETTYVSAGISCKPCFSSEKIIIRKATQLIIFKKGIDIRRR